MKKDKVIQVRVTPEMNKKLQQMADLDNRTISDFIRVQLIKLTETKKKK